MDDWADGTLAVEPESIIEAAISTNDTEDFVFLIFGSPYVRRQVELEDRKRSAYSA